MMTDVKRDPRSIVEDIRRCMEQGQEVVVQSNLTERLLCERLALAVRDAQGVLQGQGHFVVLYCPLREWAEAKASEAIGEWIYGEWSDKQVNKPLDTGEMLKGSRVVFGLGRVNKAGNGTQIALQQLAVGLIEEVEKAPRAVHFVGAVKMRGVREVLSSCPEDEFYAAVAGFIRNRGDRATPAYYPLKKRV